MPEKSSDTNNFTRPEEAVVFVASDQGRVFAVGNEETYAVVKTWDGFERTWGLKTRQFLAQATGVAVPQ